MNRYSNAMHETETMLSNPSGLEIRLFIYFIIYMLYTWIGDL